MAHRIAELLERAEHDEAAKAEAQDLILRCWERRREWTSTWPRARLADALRWADRDAGRSSDDEVQSSPWVSRLADVRSSLDEENRIWFSLAIADEPAPEGEEGEDDLLPLISDEFDDAEKRVVLLLRRLRRRAAEEFADLGPDATATERPGQARASIKALQEERAALFEAAVRELPS
ncbi:MAG TPA: hypothetical protein VM784_01965 [Actinomycetota bacterium]|nr:hypothetical protein [Actinomycetota bacterium]